MSFVDSRYATTQRRMQDRFEKGLFNTVVAQALQTCFFFRAFLFQALLHIEAEKLVDAQDKLAVQNCSLFLASSKALSSLSRSVSSKIAQAYSQCLGIHARLSLTGNS